MDEKRIVIEIKTTDSNNGGGSSSGTSQKNNGEIDLNALVHPIKSIEAQTLGKSVLLNQAYQYTKTAVKSIVSYQINRYFSLTEDYKSEQILSNTLNIIGKVSALGSAIGAGAITGSAAGPVGTAIGAVVGAAGWTINEAIQGVHRFDQVGIQLNQMRYDVAFAKTKLGLIDGGKGTEN